MSDISIRFDGLTLLATLALSVLVYVLVALFALFRRNLKMARLAALMGIFTLVLTAAFFAYWVNQGTSSPSLENVDALILPWGAIVLASGWQLAKTNSK